MASEASSVWPIGARACWRLPRVLVFVAWLFLCGPIERAVSQTEAPKADGARDDTRAEDLSASPLDYIMVFGPAERQAEWEPQDKPHRPVAPNEFREMVRRAHAGLPPSIRSARYEARFENDELVDGRTVLEIEHLGPIEAALPLNPCNLAIGSAGWADRDGETARLGLGPSGRFELRVDHGGTLEFDWSLKGTQGALGGVDFEVRLPPCPSSQFHLTLPDGRVPVIPGGIVTPPKKSSEAWQIELGGVNRVSLRIAPEDDPEGHSQFTELRERIAYNFAPAGLELTTTMRFDVLDQALSRLELLVPAELNLVAIRDGDTAVHWSETPVRRQSAKRVVIDPKPPLQGLGRELTLIALTPIRLDGPWRLPAVKVQGVHWCESVASLTVQHPLRLKDVTSDNGRISQVRSQLARRTKDAVELQLFSADAQIDVVLGQERKPPRIDYGVTIEMSGGQLAARQTVLLEADEGQHFQVVGNLARLWVVDSVQAGPGVVADWRDPLEDGQRRLVVDLAKPLSSDSPVELEVSARRLKVTERYSSRDLIPVEFVSGELGTELVELHATEPYELEYHGAEQLVQRETQELSIREQRLIPGTPGGKIYLHDGGDKDLVIKVRPRPTLYSAEIDVSVDLSGKQATESYVFGIYPESVRLGNVVVEVLKRPGTPLRWELAAGNEAHPVAGSQAGDASEVERWELRLRPSRSEFFEFRATRVFEVDDGAAIGLARLPDAAKQEGRLSIRVSGEEQVRIENRSLTPELSVALQDPAEIPRATYRYDPERSLTSGTPPMVLRVDDSSSKLPKAWVWQCQLESRLEPTGEGRHAASYRVESVGAPFLYLSLPASIGVDLIDSVEIDGRRTPLESLPTGEPAKLAVRLNASRRFHEVTVCYRTIGARWAAVQPLRIPVPEPDIPILKRNWIVWLPPGRQVMETDGMFRFSSDPVQWPANVLGPMGRAAGSGPLDPFAADLWRWGSKVEPEDDLGVSANAEDDSGQDASQDWGELATVGDTATGFRPEDTIGWTVYEVGLPESKDATVLIVDRNLHLCGLWVCFLVVAFLTWTVALRHPALSVFSIVSFLLGAAYLPEFWGPWLSAGFWGSVAGLLMRLVAIRRVRSPGRVVATRTLSETGAAAGPLVGCLLALAMAAEVGAQPAEVQSWPEAPALILAPVGSDEKPTGEAYFVPEPFYLELQRRAQRIAEEAPAWLLEEADYRARLNWQATDEPLTITEFTVDFGIEVIRPNEAVELLLGKTPGNWHLEAAWRDGRRIDELITWEPDRPIVFFADSAGACHLRLQLAPIHVYGVVRNGFQLTIPPLATSRLELTIPADATRVEVPTATGRSFIRQGQSKIAVDLGPVETLAVKWQPTGRASSGKGTQVDELIWLNLALGGALVEAQFHFDRGQDFEGELELTHDPRLEQRGTYEVEGATLEHVEEASETPRGGLEARKGLPRVRHKLSLTEVIGPKVIVRGQFLVRDASGVGSLHMPNLRSEGYDVSRRWVAATVDPRLQYEQTALGRVTTIGLSEFAEAWVGEVELPTIALELDDEQASFGLNTWPKPPQSSAQWKMSVGYGLSETLYRFRADVDTNEGYLFQHRLAVPPELEIDELTATASDLPRAIQWTRPSKEQIVVFFDAAVSGGHTVQLRGRIPAKAERVEPLQRIVLHGVENETGTIDIYRQHEAIVSLDSVEGLIEHGPPVGAVLEDGLGRGVSRWEVDGLGPVKASVRVEPNDPKVLVRQQVISLRQTSDGWNVDVDFELEVEKGKGIVDKICLETSELWPGPYVVNPGLIMEVDEDRRELVLRPPLRDEIKFQVSGPLVAKAGGRTSVPRIRLRNAEYTDQTERLVVLPVGPAPPIRWRVLGLTRTDLPSRFVARPGITWNAYRVQQDDFLATIRPSPDEAQIHLADFRLGWDAKGECRGAALYDLEAGERDSCVLRLPDGWRLVAASNQGVPISPRLEKDGAWAIPLGRTSLPQRLEFVYAGRISPDDRGPARFEMFPELEDLPVRRAIWTLAGPGESSIVGEGELVTRERVAMVRLQNVTTLINRANASLGRSRNEDAAWYRGWLAEWADARREAERAVASRATPGRAELAELEALDAEQRALAELLNGADSWERLMASSVPRVDPGTMWDHTGFGGEPGYFFSKDGSAPSLVQIDSAGAKQDMRIALSPVLYVSAILLVLFVAWATGRLHRWPHLYGVGMGLGWWLWLWPGILGLFVIAVCLLAVVRSGWRRPRSSGSGIVRLSASGRS